MGSATGSMFVRLRGFTLVELMTVLAIVAVLLTLVAPRYFNTLDKSAEVVLRHNLQTVRDCIDKYYHDRDAYPRSLDELVARKYLRDVPLDPVTQSRDTWVLVQAAEESGGIADIKSGAPGRASDGTAYADW